MFARSRHRPRADHKKLTGLLPLRQVQPSFQLGRQRPILEQPGGDHRNGHDGAILLPKLNRTYCGASSSFSLGKVEPAVAKVSSAEADKRHILFVKERADATSDSWSSRGEEFHLSVHSGLYHPRRRRLAFT